jgi:hypothetical protein
MLQRRDFVTNHGLTADELRYHPDVGGESFVVDVETMLEAAIKATKDFAVQIRQFDRWARKGRVVLWHNILEKNKGGAVGECLAAAYSQLIGDRLVKNPHESGSPDFFPLLESTIPFLNKPTKDEYEEGGIHCKSNRPPNLGFMEMEPSSHHRQTSSVLLTGWSYSGNLPQILACFYCNTLNVSDWKIGSIPKSDESKPTSSARLLPSGKEKIRRNWIFLHKSIRLPRDESHIEEYRLEPLRILQKKRAT